MSVEGNAVAQVGPTAFVGLDGLVDQRDQGGFELFRSFIDANDILVICPQCFFELLSECFNSHVTDTRNFRAKSEDKNGFSEKNGHASRLIPAAYLGRVKTTRKNATNPSGGWRV